VSRAEQFASLFDCAGCLLATGAALLITGFALLAWAMSR
jgi:hypothetical protein